MARRLQPVSKAGFRVQVSANGVNVNGVFFTEFSGVEAERESADVPTGNSRYTSKVYGQSTFSDATLMTPYDPTDPQHQLLIDLFDRCTNQPVQVTIQPVRICPDEEPYGSALTLTNAVVKGYSVGEADRGSADASMLELTIGYEYCIRR